MLGRGSFLTLLGILYLPFRSFNGFFYMKCPHTMLKKSLHSPVLPCLLF